MILSQDAGIPDTGIPWTGPKNHLVRCKMKTSPKCQKWHLNDRDGCPACRGEQRKHNYTSTEKPILSERQMQVLCLYCSGSSVKEIAPELNISSKTVEYHMAQIKRKLSIDNPTLLIHFAIQVGWVQNQFAA